MSASERLKRVRGKRRAAPNISIPKPENRIPVVELLDEDGVTLVHEHSMKIVEEIGIDFRDEIALGAWRDAGADVDDQRVRMPRELLMSLVAQAPSTYIQHARNPDCSVQIGARSAAFAPVYGSPYVRDLTGERRYARLEDFENFVKLTYLSPALNHSGGTVCEPTDIAVPHRHLHMTYGHMKWSDKPFMGAVTSAERARDCIRMAEILFGEDFVASDTVMTSLINCNSPLVWDETMLSVVRVYAAHNQACLISPFIMQGANTPITTAGAFAQLNAEALAGIAYCQLVRPGAPVIYGATLSTVSMQSGAPMYGTAESQLLTFLTGQLARRYRVPMRTGGMRNGAKCADAQAAYESTQTMMSAVCAGGNFYLHSAGWLESGLSACYAKFVMDADQLMVLRRLMGGVSLTEDDFALDAIEDVGPSGHFFGTPHTIARFADAFYSPSTANQDSYEKWLEDGEVDVITQARTIASDQLYAYEAPPLDPAINEALSEFVERRSAELPETL